MRDAHRAISAAKAFARRAAIGLIALATTAATAASAADISSLCGACTFEKYASCGQFVEGINFDRDGVGWAVSLFSGDIISIANGKCETRAKTGGKPNGARFHKDGRLYVADNDRGILIYDPKTNAISVFADKIGSEPMRGANDLIFDEKGGLYVTVPQGSGYLDRKGQVIYFAPGSNSAQLFADHLPYPNGVALSGDGKFVYIGLHSDKTIIAIPSILNPGSKRPAYALIRTEGGVGPDGMAMDAEGRVYWANFLTGAVGVSDPAGFPLGYIRLPATAGRWTTNLAFHGGYLYVTEAEKGEIWRVAVNTPGQTLFHEK